MKNYEVCSYRPVCACGCGELVKWNQHKSHWRRFLNGHNLKFIQIKGDGNPSWRGGTCINHGGYKLVSAWWHPRHNKDGYIAEHILIAESKIGRLLEDDEVVHHIDRDKLNNSPENLLVMTNSEHISLHHKGLSIGVISNNELESAMIELFNKIKRTPGINDMRKFGKYSEEPYLDRYVTWRNAVQSILGVEPNRVRNITVTDEELRANLFYVCDIVGRKPQIKDLGYGKYSHVPYIRRYGSWCNALREIIWAI